MNRSRPRIHAVISSLALGLALLAAGACGAHEEHRPGPLALDVTTVERRDVEVVDEYVCQIRAIQHIDVRSLERGYLDQIFVDEGQFVRRGQRLFQVQPIVYRAELAVASAELRSAEIQYRNTELLRQGNVVSPTELALSRAELEQREARQKLARAHLRFTTLEAPFDGIVGRLMVRRGSLLEEGETLTVLSDVSRMWVYFNVSERQYLDYRRVHDVHDRVPVRLRMANGELFPHEGWVETADADFDNETGTIAFRATFPNPDALLRHGETGDVLMTRALRGVLVIPQIATFHVLGKTFVFVVGADGEVRTREITVGAELPHRFVVDGGLREGDRILVGGLRQVRDGDRVEPRLRTLDDVLQGLERMHAE